MSRIKVFIADDSDIIRKMVKSFISKGEDLELVGEAPDGREAVKLCKQSKPDVVLLDVNMPVMNGIDAAKLLSYSLPEAILVALSGIDDIDMMREAMVAGAKDFIRKPFKAAEFNAKVKEIWGREQRRLSGSDTAESAHKLVVVGGVRQGVGCTTLLTNAAVSLAVHRGRSVLVADCDVQDAAISAALGIEGTAGVVDMLAGGETDFTALQRFVSDTGFNVQLLSGPLRPQDPTALQADRAALVFKELQRHYDVVCVDLPAHPTPFWLNMLVLGEAVLVVSNDFAAIRSARRLIEFARVNGCDVASLRLVLNRCCGGETLETSAITGLLGRAVDLEIPYDGTRTRASHEKGKPFILEDSGAIGEAVEKFIDLVMA